jgi:uncharacterized protein (DUF58 family)
MRANPKVRTLPLPRYRVPRAGKWWLALALVFWGIGALKGMNLLALLGSLMLVTWGINAVAAGRRLRGVRWRRWIERPIFAQTPVAIDIEIDTPRKAIPEGIHLEDRGPDHRRTWNVPELRDGRAVRLHAEITFPRRGRYTWPPLRAVSSSPFGLVEGGLATGQAEELVIAPQLGRVHRGRLRQFLRQAGGIEAGARGGLVRHPAALGEMFGVRNFRSGDSPRWIHWRTSARRGELMVREFEVTPSEHLIVILDPWVPEPRAGHQDLEAAISLTATVCWEWCRQHGDRLVLAILGQNPVILEGITGRPLAVSLLEALALEPGSAGAESAASLERLARRRLPPAPVLVVSTRPGAARAPWGDRLRRPAACVEMTTTTAVDFYERPTPHAS